MIFNMVTPKRRSLPAGYYRLDYIESTGTQWIDTGVSVSPTNAPKLKTVVDKISTTTGKFALDGTAYGGSPYTNGFYIGVDENGNIAYADGRAIVRTTTAYDGTRRVFTYDAPNGTLDVAGLFSQSFTFRAPDAGLNFYLFGYNGASNGADCYSGKIYAAQLYLDGVLVRNMIPCFSATDGEVGLYDKVNGVFYGNDGTGEFVGGNLVDEGPSTAIISVTAPTGSTVTATHSDGTVLTAEENNGHWTFKVTKFGTWTVSATKSGETDSETVSVTGTKVYIAELLQKVTVTITNPGGWTSTQHASVTVNGTTYKNTSATVSTLRGSPVVLYAEAYGNYSCTIYVNGTIVAEKNISVSYTIYPLSDVNIQCQSALAMTRIYVTYDTTATQALALENDGMAAALSVMGIETGGQTTAETMDELQAENTTLRAALDELGIETEEQNAE